MELGLSTWYVLVLIARLGLIVVFSGSTLDGNMKA